MNPTSVPWLVTFRGTVEYEAYADVRAETGPDAAVLAMEDEDIQIWADATKHQVAESWEVVRVERLEADFGQEPRSM